MTSLLKGRKKQTNTSTAGDQCMTYPRSTVDYVRLCTIDALRKPTDATKPNGFQQRSFSRLVCGVHFLVVFGSFRSSEDQTCLMNKKKLSKTTADEQKLVFIRPSFDGRIMVWRCPYVRPYVRSVVHNPCGQDIARTIGLGCSNLVCILYMDRVRSLFIFKVKFQGHWAFTKNSGTWILVGRI